MKIKIKYDNLDPAERKLAEEAIGKIRDAAARILSNTEPDLQRLEGHVRKFEKGHRYEVTLQLHLPSTTLVVHGEKTDFAALLAELREDMIRRVRRRLARIQHYREWRKSARRDRLAEHLSGDEGDKVKRRHELFFDLIEKHLDTIWTYAWRELAYLEATGDLPPGALSVRDAVDAILVAGARTFEEKPAEFDLTDWLYRLCVETLQSEARRIARAVPADAVSLNEEPPEPATDPTEADQEFYEFYQPDDLPTLEDLIPFPDVNTPEESYATREIAVAVHRAIAELPARWRHAVVLVYLENLPEERVVEILGISPVELADILKHARRFLRARLADRLDRPESGSDADLSIGFEATGTASPSAKARERIVSHFRPGGQQSEDRTVG